MAVYKVPQDVEAEDKLVGPFTFRQFIFLIVAAISLFLTVQLFQINPLLSLITLPVLLVFGTLGVYRRPDQPAEIYLLAVLRFYLKPHKRIWDQEGVVETVHITAPKKIEHQYTDGLSQNEVKSRLDSLAKVMDSRGWSVKNVDLNSPHDQTTAQAAVASDRLIMPTQQLEPTELHASDDMLDVYNNPAARDVQQRMQQSSDHIKEEAMERMRQAQQAEAQQPEPAPAQQPQPAPQPAQAAPAQDSSPTDGGDGPAFDPYPTDMRQRVISPVGDEPQQAAPQPAAPQPQNNGGQQSASGMTEQPSDAILNLANNSDLRISTLASEAARIESLEDDQTISLH